MSKTILITGSTSGIGLAMARAFAAEGYNIAFNGLEKDGAEIAAAVAKEHNIKHTFSPANMLQPEAIRQLVGDAITAFGTIDVLINNAGIQYVAPIDQFPEEKWNDIIAINLTAAFHTSKAVWPVMKAKKFGRIINIASAHGLFASEFKSAYISAKHGLIGLTKTLAVEGATLGITANAICPGYVKTPLVDKQIADQAKAHNMSEKDVVEKVLLEKQAIKEFIPTELIAKTAVYLASDIAATVTGIAMPLDGGWSAQ